MMVQKIAPPECLNCKSKQVQNVGWLLLEGLRCLRCNHYSKIKTGELFRIINIKNRSRNTLFENDMKLEKI